MERLEAGGEQQVIQQMKKDFKRLRRQYRSATRKGQVFPEEQIEEMLALDEKLASMEIRWNRNYPPGFREDSREVTG